MQTKIKLMNKYPELDGIVTRLLEMMSTRRLSQRDICRSTGSLPKAPCTAPLSDPCLWVSQTFFKKRLSISSRTYRPTCINTKIILYKCFQIDSNIISVFNNVG